MTFLACQVVSAVLCLNLCLLLNLDLSPPALPFPNRGARQKALRIPLQNLILGLELGEEDLLCRFLSLVAQILPRPLPLSQLWSLLRLRP